MIKPKAIGPGSMLGIVSPASAARPELVAAGIARLETLGYRTKLFPHALDRGPLAFAGAREDRLADLHAAFADIEVDAILCTRGGWGSAELLPYLDRELIRAHPKAFLGYSDLTSLHVWLQQEVGLVCFQAPMVAADFAKESGADMASWTAALGGSSEWTLGARDGLRVLQQGQAEDVLTGGCISIFVESLGTPYAATPGPCVLFLEDVGVKGYQWHRMLVHLEHVGFFAKARGVVFGDMRQCGSEAEQKDVDAAIRFALREFSGPIAIGLRSGHVDRGNVTLPFGVRVRLDCSDEGNPRMHFVEAAVEG